jgi:hypothetical protein
MSDKPFDQWAIVEVMLVRYLDRVVSMERFGSDLRIIIREQPEKLF